MATCSASSTNSGESSMSMMHSGGNFFEACETREVAFALATCTPALVEAEDTREAALALATGALTACEDFASATGVFAACKDGALAAGAEAFGELNCTREAFETASNLPTWFRGFTGICTLLLAAWGGPALDDVAGAGAGSGECCLNFTSRTGEIGDGTSLGATMRSRTSLGATSRGGEPGAEPAAEQAEHGEQGDAENDSSSLPSAAPKVKPRTIASFGLVPWLPPAPPPAPPLSPPERLPRGVRAPFFPDTIFLVRL
mmetsp:Transcript_116126/g.369523  ORF Transcript_116126/g.369523 Transcript_116126/m.369523 type:complete len:259 (+) Transcript_116126:3707-4483(+)